MANLRFVNRTKETVPDGTFVILTRSRKQDHELELAEDHDIVGLVSGDVLPGDWGESSDISEGIGG